ncbi:TPA: hypothetical protein ACGEO7_004872 [Salmonella enterica]|uniref:Uncharacterized protein n=2 Tax=Pasteurellaceae TaxID=712 RepID=A8Y978_9PAST|nr:MULTISPECIES: hypothetical protein [Gammaproteobacteria]VFY96046.1 Uncharacterised protein [Actinobacillus indolicus]CAP20324.1 hypothetical protein [Actinobacillus porcitonsillarum]CAP45547.1 hypothetical protein [Actinobacillus porcitonsillarum]CAP45549.1 hypothetical protein [Actinobacillus porcitonsillarum]CAP45554.1 hypothetical protein [Actinobacillus porcitonsillarum]
MKDYQPTNPELLNYAVELLESGKIDGIKCYNVRFRLPEKKFI